MVPQMMCFGNYFLQSSLGNIFNQMQGRREDGGSENCYENHSEALSPSTADSEGTEGTEGKDSPALRDTQDFDAVRRLLETVNTSVTIQLLEANVRKLASSPATIIKRDPDEDYQVNPINDADEQKKNFCKRDFTYICKSSHFRVNRILSREKGVFINFQLYF